MARKSAAQSGVMSEEGERVRYRRDRLGLTQVQLSELTGESGKKPVNRATIAAIEDGKNFRRSSLARIERALEAAEIEAGFNVPAAVGTTEGLVRFEFELPGEGHIRGVVEGPLDDAEALKARVRAILQENPPSDRT